eukprot:CAMPEP_0195288164 /NCGR_PEP_ID=MMETSP0707-20130614/4934_1 /TAXON_ID=33640 /ORGANISM="Asterionellopsis glacialis, Strain CCMP134" /LENGTH=335 /DNA_ID=CAMNT_0040347989 /DNA_START=328 /DNA_END=1335 /DNA_ORIENTATION=-
MKPNLQLKNGLYLLSVATVVASVVTPTKAECKGTRPSCLTLGGNDYVSCSAHEGCTASGISEACEGTPRACDTFKTSSLCSYSQGCKWDGPVDIDEVDYGGDPVGTYKGMATMDLKYYDLNGFTLQYELSEQFINQYPAVVEIRTPWKNELMQETNPFNIFIIWDTGDEMVEGGISMTSAFLFRPSNLLKQYWDLKFIGNNLEGELKDTHGSTGFGANYVIVEDSLGYITVDFMKVGTKLTGTLTPASAYLEMNDEVRGLSGRIVSFEFKFEGLCQQAKKVATSQNAYSNICSSNYRGATSDSEDAMDSIDSVGTSLGFGIVGYFLFFVVVFFQI